MINGLSIMQIIVIYNKIGLNVNVSKIKNSILNIIAIKIFLYM